MADPLFDLNERANRRERDKSEFAILEQTGKLGGIPDDEVALLNTSESSNGVGRPNDGAGRDAELGAQHLSRGGADPRLRVCASDDRV
jgi:hypothetical protein